MNTSNESLFEKIDESKNENKRFCAICSDELDFNDDLICGYHNLE